MDKERYELIGYCSYRDTETGAIGDNFVDLLNQQNKRIKKLESKLRVSNSSNASLSLDYIELKKQYDSQEELLTQKLAENSRLTQENQQLKKQKKELDLEAQRYYEDAYCNNFQNQTAIRELEKVKERLLKKIAEKQSCFDSGNYSNFADGVKTICEIMLISTDNQIEELQKQLEEKEKEIYNYRNYFALKDEAYNQLLEEYNERISEKKQAHILNDRLGEKIKGLENQIKSQPAEIVEKIKGRFLATCRIEQGNDEMIASFQTFNRCLDTILKEYQK